MFTYEAAGWSVLDGGLHQPLDGQEDVADEGVHQEAQCDSTHRHVFLSSSSTLNLNLFVRWVNMRQMHDFQHFQI